MKSLLILSVLLCVALCVSSAAIETLKATEENVQPYVSDDKTAVIEEQETESQGHSFRSYYKTLSVNNGQAWGSWANLEMCPHGTYARGFSIRVEQWQGNDGDDTAVNGIRLYCVLNDASNPHHVWTVESNAGHWGDWSHVQWCGSGGLLTSFQLSVEPQQGKGDDTAVNDIQFLCSSGGVIRAPGMPWGKWGHFSGVCDDGGICGIKTKMESPQGRGDDTALNDVQFVCCH